MSADNLLTLVALLIFVGMGLAIPLYQYGLPTTARKMRLLVAYFFEVIVRICAFGVAVAGAMWAQHYLHVSESIEWIVGLGILLLLTLAIRAVRTSIQGWVVKAAEE